MDKCVPTRQKERTEIEEPNEPKWHTETAEPKRARLLNEVDEPRCAKASVDKLPAPLKFWRTETELPSEEKLQILKLFEVLTDPCTL
jgi:hypothetical protein